MKKLLVVLLALALPVAADGPVVCSETPQSPGTSCSAAVQSSTNCVCVAAEAGSAEPSVYDDAVSLWRLDEASGTRADSIGSNDLTDNNTVGYQNMGPAGTVADFTAASSESLYFSPSSPGVIPSTGDWSLSIWYKDTGVDYAGIVGDTTAANTGFQLFSRNNNTVDLYVGYTSGEKILNAASVTGGWHNAIFSYNDTTKLVSLVVDNGTPVTDTLGADYNPVTAQRFKIGNSSRGAAYDGLVGRGGVWSRVLSAGDITSIFNAGKGKTYAELTTAEKVGLVSYWDLDEASGNRADSHGSNTLTDDNTVGSATNSYPANLPGRVASFVAANGEYLSRADGANTVWGEDGNGCTYIGWINLQNSTTYGLVFGRNSDDGTERGFEIITENNAATPIYANGTFGGSSLQVPIAYVATGWHMVAMWFDPADSKLRISVDNAGTQTTSAAAGNALQASSKPISIGKGYHGTITGLVGPTAVWSRVLTADERTALYNSGDGAVLP